MNYGGIFTCCDMLCYAWQVGPVTLGPAESVIPLVYCYLPMILN